MLWAAYGDAIGFITELADRTLVRRRAGTSEVTALVAWRRRVGGRFGIDIDLPAGCYSDDTQLRLATCRAIGANGKFDSEVFAKVELPVWRTYALGAGTGTKSAAQALAKPDTRWPTNFFRVKNCDYISVGGNGAAMRVQPHVWATAGKTDNQRLITDIIYNAVATHGHPRAILGAVFHGLCLRHAFETGKVPSCDEWVGVRRALGDVAGIMRRDTNLGPLWIPLWEERSRQSVDDAFGKTNAEIDVCLEIARSALDRVRSSDERQSRYADVVEAFDGYSHESRGTGTKTAVLASLLALIFQDDPHKCVLTSANLLGSDTDTIATMAGAIVGAASDNDPPEKVLDDSYLIQQADRLYNIGQRSETTSFHYPDLLFWQAPTTELDSLCSGDGDSWEVAGLGKAKPIGHAYTKGTSTGPAYQWYKLAFGQTVLLKQRRPEYQPARRRDGAVKKEGSEVMTTEKRDLRAEATPIFDEKHNVSIAIDEATDRAIHSGFNPEVIGKLLLQLSEGEFGVERASAFAAIIAKAKLVRVRRNSAQ
jgi:ADP-ribosylglycohydrolase